MQKWDSSVTSTRTKSSSVTSVSRYVYEKMTSTILLIPLTESGAQCARPAEEFPACPYLWAAAVVRAFLAQLTALIAA
jgi:hypothetical protein